MSLSDFQELFEEVVAAAIEDTKKREGVAFVVESYCFHVHLHGHSEWASSREVAEVLWLSEAEVVRIIDVAIMRVEQGCVHVFVRASGADPIQTLRTWPPEDGRDPFNVLWAGDFSVS
jgi:hypothetical protein